MITSYLKAALRHARYEKIEDKSYIGTIKGFRGVIANDNSLEDCRDHLEEVLEEWLMLRISRHLPIPEVDGLRLRIKKMA